MNIILLIVSIFMGTGRSVFSKKMSSHTHKERMFYINQSLFFVAAAAVLFLTNWNAFAKVSFFTIWYGAIYGILVFIAQWSYTVALSRGTTSICAMIYSMAFVITTIVGVLFWNEPFGILAAVGLMLAIGAVTVSAFSNEGKQKSGKGFLVPNLIAMLCGGCTGVLQKTHQSSADKENLEAFLIVAFVTAAVLALGFACFCEKQRVQLQRENIFSVCAGGCFGMASMLNTLLAGRLPSVVIFPVYNVGLMMLCLILGLVIFGEKPNKRQLLAFCIGIATILVLSFK
jgi:drug/metabolite transporter (DMT)-like permease